MEQTPLIMTTYALARFLKEFAKRLGLDDNLADITAQVHLQQSSIPRQWPQFILNNCMGCQKDPETCDMLNPRPENCRGDAKPEDVKLAGALAIETGRMKSCPAHVPLETP